MVNPRACYETELNFTPTKSTLTINSWACLRLTPITRCDCIGPLKVAIVGAGPAGLACSTLLAKRGHSATLFEASSEIGGQFNMAKKIPGKEEFYETLRYFGRLLAKMMHNARLKVSWY